MRFDQLYAKLGTLLRCVVSLPLALCFLLLPARAAVAEVVWDIGARPELLYSSPEGSPIKVKIGTTIELQTGTKDVDNKKSGCVNNPEPDTPMVRYLYYGTGNLTQNGELLESNAKVEYTAPQTARQETIFIFADDAWPSGATGVTAPETGSRNDDQSAPTAWRRAITIDVVNDGPTEVTKVGECSGTEPTPPPGTFGCLFATMKAGPDGTNWNDYVVSEKVTLIAAPEKACTADDLFPTSLESLCKGSSTFTIGCGAATRYGCSMPAQGNRFYDIHDTNDTTSALPPGHKPCVVVCDQQYFCGINEDNEPRVIGSFTITRTFNNIKIADDIYRTKVTVTKQ